MKKILTVLFLLFCGTGIFAQSSVPVQFDTTAFISLGVYDDNSNDLNDMEMFLKSLRGGFTGIFRFEILPTLSLGVESGVGIMTYDEGTHFIIDVPLNVVGRIGFDALFIEGHVGYYFSYYDELSGTSSGVKIGIGEWFFDASLIMAEQVYTRYTFGYQLSNML